MTLSPTAYWPDLTQSIARVLAAVFAHRWFQPQSAPHATEMPPAPLHRADLDPQHLDRAALLAELLAPAPNASTHPPLPTAVECVIARKLLAARELIQRDLLAQMQGHPVFDKPGPIGEWLRLHCAGLDHEVFLVMYLDAQQRLITIEQLFRGTLTQTSVYPREVVKATLRHNAAVVAFAHNHPSGVPDPSRADQRLTETLKSALSLVVVRVIDHFIVAGAQHYSFAEHGLI